MKNLKILIMLVLLFITAISLASVNDNFSSLAKETYYAKIQQDDVYFYSLPYSQDEYKLFEIPKTYFVILTDKIDDEFYSAKYQDLEGYVKINEVNAMNGTPIKPFPEASFRVYSTDGLGIYHYPKFVNEYKITTIPYLTENITFYGEITGGEYVPEKSNIWYYCKYTDEKDIYGYVSSVFCDLLLPEIVTNYETFEIITNPTFISPSAIPSSLSPVAMTFIIIGVTLPCLIVFYLLMKPSFMKEKVLNEKPKISKRKRHGDYFEFDENDLN